MRLNDSPLDLAAHKRRVDRLADVVGRRDPVDTDVAGIDIDGDLDALRHVAVAKVRRTGAGLGIERLGGRRRIPEEATSGPIALAPRLLGLLGGTENRIAGHERKTTRRRRAGVARGGGVREVPVDVVERDARGFGRHLTHGETSALPDLGATVEKFGTGRSLVIGVPVQDDLSLAAFGKTEREADVLEPGGEPSSLAQRGRGRGQRRDRGEGLRVGECLVEFGLQGARRDDFAHAHPLGHDGLSDAVVAVDEGVAKTHLDRIDPEFGGKPVDRRLDREVALRPTEAAEGAAGHGGGVDRPAVDPGMRDAVRTGDRQMGVPEHLVGRVVVRTGVEVDVGLECRDRAVVGRPQADADTAPVPLVMADDRFLP